MITAIIDWSVRNRLLVLLLSLMLVGGGFYALSRTPVDAIPDLSDVQVIVKTSYPGQAPEVVQEQVTYPLTSALMSVPGAETVRGFSFFGDSYVYVIFNDDTDLYWARSRVLEYLSQIAPSLPEAARPQLGPDATGVGWVFIYALSDPTGQHSLADLRAYQDWFLKFELQSLPGVAEIAPLGGMVKQYQIQLDPVALAAYKIPLSLVVNALQLSNQESGASVIEMAEAETMLRATGFIRSIADLENIPLGIDSAGVPLLLKDVATISSGPQMRRGIAELNGDGEVVGGIVVMRFGENAKATIEGVKQRLENLKSSLPPGVEISTVYDRTRLIDSAIDNLWQKLTEEFVVVAIVCALFLFHLRSSLVILLSLPVGILAAFVLMKWQGINANIMSLGGIAIAIGAMVDGAIVMIENLHKHLEAEQRKPEQERSERWALISRSAQEVGPALFFSLLIITLSFLPVFALEAQEGRMFAPLAFTKTYAMGAAAILAITLVPVLMGYFVRGHIQPEHKNPLNRALQALYLPLLTRVLTRPKTLLVLVFLVALSSLYPLKNIGSEFMPPLDEGDLMYMPTTYPGLSIGEARQLLQQTDKLIRSVPEVETVFGKIGRAETATDPAPLTMIETFIQLKPKDQWRDGITTADIRAELEQKVQFPGLSNAWVMPIKTRIDMLATGIKTPVGLKIAGSDLQQIQAIGQQLEGIIKTVPGTVSAYAERVAGGRYLTLDIRREQAARYGLSVAQLQQIITTTIGGKNIIETVEGLERYGVNLRYPQAYRDSPEALKQLFFVAPNGQLVTLGDVVDIRSEAGPAAIKSENARINGWLFIDIDGVDIGHYVDFAQNRVQQALNSGELTLPAGYSLRWSGQYEYMQRAKEKLQYVVPLTIAIIALLLYLSFNRLTEVAMILLTLPLALVGSLWLMWALGFNFSVAVGVGFIALAGVAVEIGVIMLVYLNQSYQAAVIRAGEQQRSVTQEELRQAVIEGAGLRLRPVAMTVATIAVGLLPVMLGSGTGSEIMSRIAAPMVGGTASALLLTLVVIPVLYFLWRQREIEYQT
ncbi:efflux RND transporter permease subunit [Thalassolituus pacificus]|uniref:CusA/CzcA family heavy metal efflux RND transporter n=1 Tax=Thalassolituus pacificus TaxID=2975440 RepID=A0A9X2WHI9_9GAMM|nr:CusA/CzcA family heavy metal efflux RND transporter [Thalassolituus pacificus]MCT7360478.1 CusA/CzcA family heavy metal efflux RND transporter [Thalassolituus pacificus]